MNLPSLNPKNPLDSQTALNELIYLLQSAHAGEKAAANAYWGHGYSLFVKSKIERDEILLIYKDELHHRLRLREMLSALSSKPRPLREILMYLIGSTVAFLCLWGGWFIPMYGAGKLESTNIEEYEVAARLALMANQENLIDELLTFAEIEWDHELYFREKAKTHWLYGMFPKWKVPSNRESIRSNMEEFKKQFLNK